MLRPACDTRQKVERQSGKLRCRSSSMTWFKVFLMKLSRWLEVTLIYSVRPRMMSHCHALNLKFFSIWTNTSLFARYTDSNDKKIKPVERWVLDNRKILIYRGINKFSLKYFVNLISKTLQKNKICILYFDRTISVKNCFEILVILPRFQICEYVEYFIF